MQEKSPYSHGLRLDKPMRLSNDNLFGYIPRNDYIPVTPPVGNNLLLLDDTSFLLLDGSNFLLL